jgi:hypothetical protein
VEEGNASNMNSLIISRNIFGLVGSSTGKQALAMLNAKEDERVTTTVAPA